VNDTSDAEIWIRVHEQLARDAGKVAYLGEFGKPWIDDPTRAQIYDLWLRHALIEQRSSGSLVWQMVYDGRSDNDGFAIYCPQHVQTCAVLEKYAGFVNCPPVYLPLLVKSFPPPTSTPIPTAEDTHAPASGWNPAVAAGTVDGIHVTWSGYDDDIYYCQPTYKTRVPKGENRNVRR
jgi:hypothetical protein